MKTKKILKLLIVLMFIITAIPVGVFVFRNSITTYIIEKTGTAVAGALVEVDGVSVGPFSASIRWERLQVTDKDDTWKNILDTGDCGFSFQLMPLFAGKCIIEEMKVDNLRSGTPRKTDGKVVREQTPAKESKPSWVAGFVKKKLEEEKAAIPVLDPELFDTKVDTEKIIAALELVTPGNSEKLKTFSEDKYTYWEQKLKSSEYKDKVRAIRKDIESIDLKKIKNYKDLEKAIKVAEASMKEIKALRKQIKNEERALKKDLKQIRDSASQIPDWIRHDYETALKKAKLADFSAENISMMLFGDRVTSALMMLMDYLESSRKLSTMDDKPEKEAGTKKEKMPHLPAFWVKKMDVSATLKESVKLSGVVTDLSTSHKKTGKPLTIDLKGDSEKAGKISISSILDYRKDAPEDIVKIDIRGIDLKQVTLPSTSFFPETIKSGAANIETGIVIKDSNLTAGVAFVASKIVFDYSTIKSPGKKAAEFAKAVAQKAESVNFTGNVSVQNDTVDIDFNSNLDSIIATEIKRMLTGELEKAKKDLKRKLDKKLSPHTKELTALIGANEKELNALLAGIDKDTAREAGAVDRRKKELEKKATKELEQKAKKAGDELLEKLKLKF